MLQATTRQCKDAHDFLEFKMRASPFLADEAGLWRILSMSREGAIANMVDGKEQEEEAVRRWSGRQKKKT